MPKQYRLIYDENLCIGCQACSVACRVENNVPDNFFRLQVHVETKGIFPNLGMQFARLSCVMCENPPCVKVCPTNASFQDKEGLVHINEKVCITCHYCILACPYHARFVNPVTNVVEKCTFCYETRVSKELLPACVSICTTDALSFGDMKDVASPMHQQSLQNVLVFPKAHLGTKPKVAFIPSRKGIKS